MAAKNRRTEICNWYSDENLSLIKTRKKSFQKQLASDAYQEAKVAHRTEISSVWLYLVKLGPLGALDNDDRG